MQMNIFKSENEKELKIKGDFIVKYKYENIIVNEFLFKLVFIFYFIYIHNLFCFCFCFS